MDNPKRHHSFFWPTLLIGVGIVWLLVNFGIIQPFSVNTLLQFWPLLLVVLGLDILFGRRFAWVGGVFGLLAVGAVIAFLAFGPKTDVSSSAQTRVDKYSAPLGETTSLNFNVETASEPVNLYASNDNTLLYDASIAHQGVVNFIVNGTTDKSVHLYETAGPSNWLSWNFTFDNFKWDIGLNPSIPTKITLNGGSGSINADLSGLQLESLNADLGSGSSNFTIPASETSEDVTFNSGSGSVNVDLPAATTLTMQLESGSGSVSINLPADAEVRIEVMDSGSGSLSLPNSASRVSGDVETGAWESAGYATAAHPILIQIIDRGSGSISIH
jgi:hypothetical protein